MPNTDNTVLLLTFQGRRHNDARLIKQFIRRVFIIGTRRHLQVHAVLLTEKRKLSSNVVKCINVLNFGQALR